MAIIVTLGLGILSWKGAETLKFSLESYQENGLFDLFDQRIIFLPEQREVETEIARKFPLTIYGHPNNLGILGGFDYITHKLTTKYVIILENDFILTSDFQETKKQILMAKTLLEDNIVDIVRLRSRVNPGEPLSGHLKFRKFYPSHEASWVAKIRALTLRFLRPASRKSALGMSYYQPSVNLSDYPDAFQFYQDIPITTSQYLPWTNNPCFVKKEFMVKSVLDYALNYPSKRRVNGFKNLEIETNNAAWRNNCYKIALPKGLFTHQRIEHRGY